MKVIFISGPSDGQLRDIYQDGGYVAVAVATKMSASWCCHDERTHCPHCNNTSKVIRYKEVFNLGHTKVYAPDGVTLELVMSRLLEKYINKEN